MIKDIVVNLGLGERDPAGDFAISVAETFEAHLLGVAFVYDPVIPGSVMGGIPPQFIESQRREFEKKAAEAIARFEQAAKRAGISYETQTTNASIAGAAERLGRLARRFDLAIVGQPERDRAAAAEVVDEGVLFDSGRPVIFVPYIQKAGLKLDRVMICWDGSRAATRAVADCLPFLERAKPVEIVIVAGRPARTTSFPAPISASICPPWIEGGRQAHHLAGHRRDLHNPVLRGRSSTDMIVMGGYGHSRLREFVLGGVTRSILKR